MLRASIAFLAEKNIAVNDQLFLTGYSEGGYATIALQKSIYQLNKIDEMYQTPYRTIINNSFDGSLSGGEIDGLLPGAPADLFEADFLALLQGSGSYSLKEAIVLNDIYDWNPSSPTRLYHGVSDETVPYSNSEKALQTMQANGSTNVTLNDCPLTGHVACAVPYVFDTLNFFSIYVEDL